MELLANALGLLIVPLVTAGIWLAASRQAGIHADFSFLAAAVIVLAGVTRLADSYGIEAALAQFVGIALLFLPLLRLRTNRGNTRPGRAALQG